jgi:LacI family transcriptional regulator
MARALKTSRTHNLGILFIDQMRSGLGHEYFSQILENFKVQAEARGYDITFISQNIGGQSMSYLAHCRYRGCDGVVIACVDFTDPQVLELVAGDIPVVTIDRVFDNRSAILSDNLAGMQALVSYIHAKGHRKLAFIHGEDTDVTRRRLAGFHRVCRQVGIEVPDDYVQPARFHDPKRSAEATRRLLALEDRPTCILYPDDFSYLGGMSELERAGLKVPQDISAAGYDGIRLSQVIRPRLTTLQQDTEALGSAAALQLIQAIEDPKAAFPEQIVLPGRLLPGETVAAI